MIKLAYQFKTVGPLHTGSDINAGTLRTLRRQKCILSNSIIYQSRLSDDDRRDAVVHIALGIWYAIDWDTIKGKRAMGIYDEFTNKLIAAGRSSNKYQFLETLIRSWGIESMTNPDVLHVFDILSDYELLDIVRNEPIYIVLKMRAVKDALKNNKIDTIKLLEINPHESKNIERKEDYIPCISGNSIRGKIRRLIMSDFCKKIGIEKLDKRVYHTMFTGGFLDQSTQYEDLDKMEKFVMMCPAIGILGAAIGNMTIEGDMKIGWAYPLCKERGTSDKSYWQYLDTVFQTKHDSSKTEKNLELSQVDYSEKQMEQTHQMKYEYEVFSDGTPFDHRIACVSDNPLLISVFWHCLKLFNESPYIGGMSAVGNGEVKPDWNLPDNENEYYVNYIEENKDKIREYWANARI